MTKKKIYWISTVNSSGNHLIKSLLNNKASFVNNKFEEIILNYIFYIKNMNIAISNKNLLQEPEKILRNIFGQENIHLIDEKINLNNIFFLLKKYFFKDCMIIVHTNYVKDYEFYLYTRNKKKFFVNNLIIKEFFLILKKFLIENNYYFEKITLLRNPLNIIISNQNKHTLNTMRKKWAKEELPDEINNFLLNIDEKNKKIFYEELVKNPKLLENIFKIKINKISMFKYRNHFYSLSEKKYNEFVKKFFYFQSKKLYNFKKYNFLKFKICNYFLNLAKILEEAINLRNFKNNKDFYYHTDLNLTTKILIRLFKIKYE